ncbi:MAG: TlyA family RNA methyltransferase [Oscillospiraceae bacterium]|nr:TlyA family RNA methyltransferase [Oscillospiraceae bacterium]
MKERLDILMLNRGLCESREKAKALIMAGLVFVDGERCDKAGTFLDPAAEIVLTGKDDEFVSRGGKKLKKAVEEFKLDLRELICADIGASTGGFTDCMLQNGAKKVYAVDVGYGQLAWKLRTDPRVVNLERTNFRYASEEQIPEKLDFFSVDVSFISLKLILPALTRVCAEHARGVCLIKPQFEAGREKVGKHGVVTKPETHIEVIEQVAGYIEDNNFGVKGLTFSPIKGPEGNIEYLVYIENNAAGEEIDPAAVVRQAHAALNC